MTAAAAAVSRETDGLEPDPAAGLDPAWAARYAGKAPFPWFGGKSRAAPVVWAALGDPAHYVEPFAGSLAVLLARPHPANRAYVSETVNDADGLLVNAWRAIQLHPRATADACSWPVSEADLHARHCALLRWRAKHQLEHLMGDPRWCDAEMAGWWLYGLACWIGAGFCTGSGPWAPDAEGRLVRRAGRGGVSRQLPHLSKNGQGVVNPDLRALGISRKAPWLSDDGRGVNNAVLRSGGVGRTMPTLSKDGQGVTAPQLRAPGIEGADAGDFHPRVMPKLDAWFAMLSARLRHVRIVNGDWARVLTSGALDTLSVRKGQGPVGVFLDPPYAADTGRDMGLYVCESGDISAAVRAWALAHGERPNTRIVLAGWTGEHDEELEAAGWTARRWFANGFLTGGYANQGGGTRNDREILWCSPACLSPIPAAARPVQGEFDL